ncbi:hypothetical protein GCM10027265_25140 [Jatrophihabitans fulvus]
MLALSCLLAGTAATACGSDGPPAESGRSTRVPFDGPLFVAKPASAQKPWTGAAGTVVQCTGRVAPGSGVNTAPFREGSVGDTPERAFADSGFTGSVSTSLLRLERRDGDRALFTSVYGGKVVQALVARYGPAVDGTGRDSSGRGWWPESWASCDLSEWPAMISDASHVNVWTDRDGRRVDTRRVISWVVDDDDDKCLGDDTVEVGKRRFVRAPFDGTRQYFREPFRTGMPLPSDARDTGWSLDGVRLWLSSSRPRAYLGRDASDVEFWPELVEPVGCG